MNGYFLNDDKKVVFLNIYIKFSLFYLEYIISIIIYIYVFEKQFSTYW